MLVAIAKPMLRRSTVSADKKQKEGNFVDNDRTSNGAWLSRYDPHPAIDTFARRVSEWTAIARNHGEQIQILQYQIGQEYKPHHDYFDPKLYKDALRNGGQRQASVLCFLSDVDEGGETTFPYINTDVKPHKGAAVLWFNLNPDGSLDYKSQHGGKPVLKGIKFAAVQWMHVDVVS